MEMITRRNMIRLSSVGTFAARALTPGLTEAAAETPKGRVVDVVLEGGGAKGFAFVGALQALQEADLRIRRVVGTSAGAITALMLAAGYTAHELMEVMRETIPGREDTLVFKTFLDTPERKDFTEDDINNSETLRAFSRVMPFGGKGTLNTLLLSKFFRKLFNLNEFGGLYAGEKFGEWLEERLKKKGYKGDETFETFEAKNGTDLTVVASDTTAQRELILNRMTAPRCPVAKAVRMSMSIPLIWREVTWQAEWGPYNGEPMGGHIVVDGGILSNFPLDLVVQENHPWMNVLRAAPARPLGFLLDENMVVENAGGGPARAPATETEGDPTPQMVKRASRLIDTMSGARDLETIGKFKENVCSLPTKGYGVVEFDMPRVRLEALVKAGHEAAAAFVRDIPVR